LRARLIVKSGFKHQIQAIGAFQTGLVRHGIKAELQNHWGGANDADFVVAWNTKNIPDNLSRPFVCLEAGYINGRSGDYVRDRLRFISAGWNGLHGRAGSSSPDRPPDRWDSLGIELQPWRYGSGIILICGQHPGDVQAPRGDPEWDKVLEMGELHGSRVIFRPHPLLGPNMRPLSEALGEAKMVVTWSSTAAVEAVITGVPTVALDRGSIAWEVTSHGISEPPYVGPREQWAANLAYKQWTRGELESGAAWETLRHGYIEEAA